ncbi:MAG: S1 RNA-binding domain-containing protein [Microcoleaceae cyanobacterium]
MATNETSFSLDDFAKALDQHDYGLQKGQIISGQVFEYGTDGAYVDIVGAKSPGFIPRKEAAVAEVDNLEEVLPLKEEREFLIIRDQNADGQVLLSIRQLELQKVWNELADSVKSGRSLQVQVTGVNRGGVTVDVDGLRGFIPRSHLLERDNLNRLIDDLLTVNIIELDRDRNKLVLSQRMATETVGFSQLEQGQLVEGTVSSVKPFGVFVDLDGVTGLIHIKEVSQKFIESLADLFPVGESVKALIIDLDEGRRRVSLSTRLLENYPGEMVEKLSEVMESAEARAERAKKLIS